MIPLVDLKAQYADIAGSIHTALMDVLESQRFIGGHQVEAFEEEWASFVAAPHCVGCGNGTDALELALRALGIGAGDIVMVPAMTFQATAEAVINAGATPCFVDTTTGGQMWIAGLEAMLDNGWEGPLPKAVIPVHLYGHPFPTPLLHPLKERFGFEVIEDAAQAHGAVYHTSDQLPVGGLAWTTCTWSFFPGKNLGAYGDAGAVTTHDPEVADRVRALKDHGRPSKHAFNYVGRNSRMDAIQAAVLRVKLEHLTKWIHYRRVRAAYYDQRLEAAWKEMEEDSMLLAWSRADQDSAWHIYSVFVAFRDRIFEHMQEAGIGVGVHYPTIVPLTRAMNAALRAEVYAPQYELRGRRLPRRISPTNHPWRNAAAVASTQISLPLYPEMSEAHQDQVIDTLLNAGGKL